MTLKGPDEGLIISISVYGKAAAPTAIHLLIQIKRGKGGGDIIKGAKGLLRENTIKRN